MYDLTHSAMLCTQFVIEKIFIVGKNLLKLGV